MLYAELVGPSKKEFADAIKDVDSLVADDFIENAWRAANLWTEATLRLSNLYVRSVIHNDVLYIYIRRYQ